MNITNKGFIFSFDAAIAIAICIAMLFLILLLAAQKTQETMTEQKNFELWKNALFLSDSLIKNSSEESIFGSALFDEEKKRVKSNELDLKSLESINGFENNEFEIKKIGVETKEGKKIFFEKKTEKNNCIAIERIVLFEGKTAKLFLEACNE